MEAHRSKFVTGVFFVFFVAGSCWAKDALDMHGSVLWTEEAGYMFEEGFSVSDDTVAWGNFTNAINQTGWSYLEIKTDPKFPDTVQAHAAGFLEGRLTSQLLYWYWINTVQGMCADYFKQPLCGKIVDFVRRNMKWVESMVAKHGHTSSYWHHVGLFYDQIDGMTAGYAAAVKANAGSIAAIPHGDIMWMNIFGDLEDLEAKFRSESGDVTDKPSRFWGSGHCSALIKLLPDNKNLFVSQVTWNSYQSMLRVLKKYDLGFHWLPSKSTLVPGQTMAFSSYPGVVYSGDDFTLTSAGMAIQETTIGNGNASLWSSIKPRGGVLEGARATVANRLANNGKHWVKTFARHNSGTYNNQWMVVDYKRFKAGHKRLRKGLLWVLEQIPAHIHSEDMTWQLHKQSYWPSYNTPFFKDIFNMSGGQEQVEKHGDWFSYERTPRALIFKRNHTDVHDLESMTRLMRYNNFRHDPLSRCNCTPPFSAENAISARSDLNPANGTYPFAALGHRSHGATDMKLTDSRMIMDLKFVAAGGPTHDELPPFRWSEVDFAKDTPHVGHPDLWNFDPVRTEWRML